MCHQLSFMTLRLTIAQRQVFFCQPGKYPQMLRVTPKTRSGLRLILGPLPIKSFILIAGYARAPTPKASVYTSRTRLATSRVLHGRTVHGKISELCQPSLETRLLCQSLSPNLTLLSTCIICMKKGACTTWL